MVNRVTKKSKGKGSTKSSRAKGSCTIRDVTDNFQQLSYMTEGIKPAYTGLKSVDTVVDRGLNYAINKIPNPRVRLAMKVAKNSAPVGAYVARGVTAVRNSCRKK